GKCVSEGISEFCGVKRRFEKKGILESGALVIDDYAHHPDEIEATLKAAKKVCKGRVFCIFQPHTYTRFEALMEDFAKSLSLADVVVMADVYAAREKNVNGISSKDIRKYLPSAEYFGSFEEIAEFIKENAKEGDMAITMGAGDVYKVSDFLF
nr:UDP-N-acetylmuramate--L-alanine ligase [Clostridiales bacterium]